VQALTPSITRRGETAATRKNGLQVSENNEKRSRRNQGHERTWWQGKKGKKKKKSQERLTTFWKLGLYNRLQAKKTAEKGKWGEKGGGQWK